MLKVLFICIHNSARSQMAEAFLNRLGEGLFVAESAGLEAGKLNPFAVQAMAEVGYDLSQNATKSAFDFLKQGKQFQYVIKVCDEINGQRCPIFPFTLKTFSWNLEDPSSFNGTPEEKLAKTRVVRDQILVKVKAFIDEFKDYAQRFNG